MGKGKKRARKGINPPPMKKGRLDETQTTTGLENPLTTAPIVTQTITTTETEPMDTSDEPSTELSLRDKLDRMFPGRSQGGTKVLSNYRRLPKVAERISKINARIAKKKERIAELKQKIEDKRLDIIQAFRQSEYKGNSPKGQSKLAVFKDAVNGISDPSVRDEDFDDIYAGGEMAKADSVFSRRLLSPQVIRYIVAKNELLIDPLAVQAVRTSAPNINALYRAILIATREGTSKVTPRHVAMGLGVGGMNIISGYIGEYKYMKASKKASNEKKKNKGQKKTGKPKTPKVIKRRRFIYGAPEKRVGKFYEIA